ncbi:MAG: formylmethanofuran dehydrogenase subunit C [Candidatus Bathyarchaeota archaeon]|nr:formylmethanofuran dehydrogenase subunit C [Candidatus Bathyarchaeota archaeon]
MRKLVLKPKGFSKIPIEAEVISPDIIGGKTLPEVKALSVQYGNKVHSLSEFFDVGGRIAKTPDEQDIVVDGDASHVKYIGKGMTTGRIVVQGDAGMHTGSQMKGGSITVTGNIADWTGAEMKGGLLRVLGDAGNLLGAAYRGSSDGMTGGCIVVNGSVGSEVASFMRRGMIVVLGDTGPFTGVHMNGGEIFVFGKVGRRAGAQAKGNGGFIACFGGIDELLPTYRYDTTFTPTFMRLYLRQLAGNLGIDVATSYIDKPMRRYRGDLAVGGNAEILVAEKA